VWSAREWPGITSIPALLGGKPLVGRWRDYSAEYELRRRRQRRLVAAAASGRALQLPKTAPVWREYPIPLVPLPQWRELPVGKQRAVVVGMLNDDTRLTRERHERNGTCPLDPQAIVDANPFSRPANPKRSPAPLCHASARPMRRAFREAYRRFVDGLRACTEVVADFVPSTGFPVGSTVPPIHCRRSFRTTSVFVIVHKCWTLMPRRGF